MKTIQKEYTRELMIDFGPDDTGIIPVITQHIETKEVLILSYINKKAYEETVQSGYATYYSRSRKEIWKKGATSGDYLKVHEIRINCMQNSLLFLVTTEGKGVCHAKKNDGLPYPTCYYRRIEGNLLHVIE
jgi:phosphoribosyl-AMP cyclohydrolase